MNVTTAAGFFPFLTHCLELDDDLDEDDEDEDEESDDDDDEDDEDEDDEDDEEPETWQVSPARDSAKGRGSLTFRPLTA
jgi:hypothetical protein